MLELLCSAFRGLRLPEDSACEAGSSSSSSSSTACSSTAGFCCPICLDDAPTEDGRELGCGHRYCVPCFRRYLQEKLALRAVPVRCPEPGCAEAVTEADCKAVLPTSDFDRWLQLEAEQAIPQAERFYCPKPECSALLLLPASGSAASLAGPSACPECRTRVCLACKVVWHANMSCRQYQSLPAGMKQPEERALLEAAQAKNWRSCPSCSYLIELREGCNHMTCRCGFEFCFLCGTPYERDGPSGSGSARKACRCDLYDRPAVPPPVPGRAELLLIPSILALVADIGDGVPESTGGRGPVPAWVPDNRRPVYKTELCRFHEWGNCRSGNRCTFAHGAGELRERARGRRRGYYSDSDDDFDLRYDSDDYD